MFFGKKNQINFYRILNLSPQAPGKEIKKAYLKLVQTYHPDKNRGNKLAEKRFQKINEAWQILKDPVQKKLFDERLKKNQRQQQEIKRDFSFPVIKVASEPRAEAAIDLQISLEVSLEDLCQSRLKTINYFKSINNKKEKSSFSVQIPLGAKHGTRLCFKGEGGATGQDFFGDLFVQLKMIPHKIFQLSEKEGDLFMERPISFIDAIKATKIDIPSPYGFLALNVNPPTENGQFLKVKNHGLVKNKKGNKGDLIVKIFIEYPVKNKFTIQREMEKLSFERQKIYIEKFKQTSFVYPKILSFQKRLQELKKEALK